MNETHFLVTPGQKPALVYKNQSFSYTALLQHIACYAAAFAPHKPSKVLVFADNSPEFVFAFYGALRCGAVVVPADAQSSPKELAYMMADCRPEVLFCTEAKRETVDKALSLVEPYGCVLCTEAGIDLSAVEAQRAEPLAVPALDQTMCLIYTSGTTGNAKGVMLSYDNVLFNCGAVSEDVSIYKEDSRVLILLPLHHVFPLLGTLVAPLSVHATTYMAERMTPDAILGTLKRGRITLMIGVPKLYDVLVEGIMKKINEKAFTRLAYRVIGALGSDALAKKVFAQVHTKFGGHIQYLVSGGAALSKRTARILKNLGFYVLEGYGMTEAAPMISFTRPGRRKIGYTGDPLTGVELRFTDKGEVCVRGRNVMQGYYNRPEETAQVIQDGWLHTGDTGCLDRHGLRLTGRIKEIIVTSGGKNINPEELEAALCQRLSYIKEVAVFMQNDCLRALICPKVEALKEKTLDCIQNLVKKDLSLFNREVSVYKRIKKFDILCTDLPRTRLGKIQRFKLSSLLP